MASSPTKSKKQQCWLLYYTLILISYNREEIGILTSLPLLRNVVHDLEEARNTGECSLTLYFTKESHIHTLVNLVLQSGLPIANPRIPELDYAVCKLYMRSTLELTSFQSPIYRKLHAIDTYPTLTFSPRFELYERIGGRGGRSDKEYSIRLSLSEGAHSSNVLDSALDARHSLNVKQKRQVVTKSTAKLTVTDDYTEN
jgi:inositol hexakisphosphate/diphosphoinositol-pentakisphosphate kinase